MDTGEDRPAVAFGGEADNQTSEVVGPMKLRLQHEDGRIEVLTVRGPIELQEGRELDRLVTPDSEHFFTKDGYYDGWGRSISATPAEAVRLRETIEALRQIEDTPTA